MDITHLILKAFLATGDPVLYILLGMSVFAVSVIAERALVLVLERRKTLRFEEDAESCLAGQDLKGMEQIFGSHSGSVIAAALKKVLPLLTKEGASFQEGLDAEMIRVREYHERGLVILASIGSNAPFIGLFGTVLGIIKAFRDLGMAASMNANVVMTGISEALVATGLGLLVAIPTVIAFNYFQALTEQQLAALERLKRLVLAHHGGTKR